MANNYDLVIFDCDGTLVDSLAGIARSANLALREVGFTEGLSHQAVAAVVGLSLEAAVAVWVPAASETVRQRLVASYKAHYRRLADAGELVTPVYPGVRPVLETLQRAGVTMAVATGKSMAGLSRTLRDHDLAGFFQSLRTADMARSKPDPEMVTGILRETGRAPERTLMVGDTTFDIHMGRRAGVDTCAVTYGYHDRDRLARAEPHHWLHRMADLPALLGLESPGRNPSR